MNGISDCMRIPYKVYAGAALAPPRRAVLDPYDSRNGCMVCTAKKPHAPSVRESTVLEAKPWDTEQRANLRDYTEAERLLASSWG